MSVTPEEIQAIHVRMSVVAGSMRLRLGDYNWQGLSGNFLGAGVGSSIDFQDHRQYYPGDDPRHIDWRAYARSDQYVMKLYREEVAPRIDVVFDTSPSMFYHPDKAKRSLELLYFCIECAGQYGASLRTFFTGPENHAQIPLSTLLAYQVQKHFELRRGESSETRLPSFEKITWRYGSLRVYISDLLFSGEPELVARELARGMGRSMILSPFCREESNPTWDGNIRMYDCESSLSRTQLVNRETLEHYRRVYQQHFELWREASRKSAISFARVLAQGDFLRALEEEAFRAGIVEAWR